MLQQKIILKIWFSKDEFDILIKALDYYNNACAHFDYSENIETCHDIRNRLTNNARVEGGF